MSIRLRSWGRAAVLLWCVACRGAARSGSRGAAGEAPLSDAERPGQGSAAAPAQAPTAPAADTASHRVLFVGTSLTAGLGLDPDSAYPERIQRKIDSAGLGYVVENAGVSGETSAGLLRRLDWLLRQPFSVVVLETGANDGLRGTPVAETSRNIQEVITRVKATHPAARVLLVQMEAPPNFGTQYTSAFHDMFPRLARETGVALLPFLLTGVAGIPSLNQGDGIHPNDRGERIVADNVWRGLEPLLRPGARHIPKG